MTASSSRMGTPAKKLRRSTVLMVVVIPPALTTTSGITSLTSSVKASMRAVASLTDHEPTSSLSSLVNHTGSTSVPGFVPSTTAMRSSRCTNSPIGGSSGSTLTP